MGVRGDLNNLTRRVCRISGPGVDRFKADLAAKDRKEACDRRPNDCRAPMGALRAVFAIEPLAFSCGYKILVFQRGSQCLRGYKYQSPKIPVGAVALNGLCATRAVDRPSPRLRPDTGQPPLPFQPRAKWFLVSGYCHRFVADSTWVFFSHLSPQSRIEASTGPRERPLAVS